jgi:hypothetical protein
LTGLHGWLVLDSKSHTLLPETVGLGPGVGRVTPHHSRDDVAEHAADAVEDVARNRAKPHHGNALGERVDAIDANGSGAVEPAIFQIGRLDAKRPRG